MSFAVIESKAGFKSAASELLDGALEFVLTLVGAFVHANAKLSTAANETITWIRFFILESPRFRCWFRIFYAEYWPQVNRPDVSHAQQRFAVAVISSKVQQLLLHQSSRSSPSSIRRQW